MATLSDFNAPVKKPKLSEFFAVGKNRAPVINPASVNNVAAYTASLVPPEQMDRTYTQVTDELNYGTSDLSHKVLAAFDDTNQRADYQTLTEIAADPSLSFEERQRVIENFSVPGADRTRKSFYERTAAAALMANSEPEDNDETDFVRLDTNSVINEVDAYNGWVQKKLNEMENLSNPNFVQSAANMLVMMVPFYEQLSNAQVSSKLFGEDGAVDAGNVLQSLVLLGENKQAVRDAIKAMPLETRREFAQKVMDLTLQSSGPTAFNENDLVMMNELRSYLETGGYGDSDRAIDNIFSILDSTVILTPFVKGAKGLGRFSKAVGSARQEAAVLARYEQAMKALDTPEAVADVASVLPRANSDIDNLIDSLSVMDKGTADEIADARNVITASMEGVDDVSIDSIIDRMRILDKATAEEIAQVRQALAPLAGKRNADLQSMVNEETIKGTQELVADKVIGRLEQLDSAPVEVFNEIRQVITASIDPVTITKPGLSVDLINRVNAVLENRKLAPIDTKTGGQLKSFITNSTMESNIRRRAIRARTQPSSILETYKDTNPGKFRAAVEMIATDKTGRAAEILAGTNKADAIADVTLPEVKMADNSVRNKVVLEAAPAPDQALINQIKNARGDIHFSKAEKKAMRSKAIDEWRDIQGLVPRNEMTTIGNTDRGVSFDVVYGPKDGGFAEPSQALEQARFGLAKYGVKDDQIEVLRFDGNNYVPVSEWKEKGNYLIRVKHDYEFSPADTIAWSLTKAGNWKLFDAIPPLFSGRAGGFSQHLIPSTAVIDRLLLDAASVAADRSSWIMKRMLELGNEYAKKYTSLEPIQKRLVDDYIVRANAKGLKFDSNFLASIGMTDKAIDTIRSWKTVNDTLYHFENLDVIKTLRARGFMHYVDNYNQTDMIVKPIAHNQTGDVTWAFNGENIKPMRREEIAEIYEKGGTIAKTRGPVEYKGDTFEYVIVDNAPASSYLRSIADTDNILTYRDGYYTVRYSDPYFITKKSVGKDGKEYWKAIATAGDRKLAEAELNRLRAADNAGEYGFRQDLKKGSDVLEDTQWEAMVSGGRTAQRIRGERLKAVGETESDMNKLHVDSPEESLVKSIRSLANRVSHRDFIETAKKRYINQFKDLVPTERGLPQWPDDVRQIGKNNAEASLGRMADARATWRYIEAIDSGYVNLIDDASKNFFKFFSDVAGRTGWSWLEKGLRQGEALNPTGWARKKAFRLLLAFNPLRQLPVQAMQALPVILATNPTAIGRIANQFILLNYIVRGGDVDSFFKAVAKQATGLNKQQAIDLVKNYELSGFEASVKANSLIRDDMKGLVDKTLLQKAGRWAAKPGDFLQKIGFEAGENILMRSVWLSEYDKLLRSKKGGTIGMEDLETLNAKVRHLTLNMNKAGELPYNENALSALLQFFQAPHKAFAQVVMQHKGLTWQERTKLGALYITTYGIGANYITDMISKVLPEDSGMRDVIEGGVFNILMNKALSAVYGEDVRTDFSDSLRLFTPPNVFQFFQDIIALNFGEMITNSPSASLVFGDNPRVTRFVKALARPFTIENGWSNPEEFQNVGLTFLGMFSGGSNIMKAKYILEHQKQIGAMGQDIDVEANYVEAILKAGGFATMDEVRYYALNDKTYKASQAWKNDIEVVLEETSRRLSLQGIANDDAEYWLKMMAEAQRVFGNDPFYLKEFQSQLNFRATQDDYAIFETLMRLAPVTSEEEMKNMIEIAPIPNDQKETVRGMVRVLTEHNGE